MPIEHDEHIIPIPYEKIIANFPWIIQRNQKAIISPDSDGFLCGLFMSHLLDWEIVGFYDTKVLLLKKGISAQDCIFLDVEIYRKNIRSVGQHMVLFNKDKLPPNWDNFEKCLQPNILRNHDKKHDFKEKYPLATIHFLIGIIGSQQKINLPQNAFCPLLYADGTFKSMLNYPENCLSWLAYLGGDKEGSPLHKIHTHYSLHELMHDLARFFKDLQKIGKKADKLKLTDKEGNPINLLETPQGHSIAHNQKNKIETLLRTLAEKTEWKYKEDSWTWENLQLFKFTKPSPAKSTRKEYDALMGKNPLSLAMARSTDVEYTLEEPDKLP